MNDVSVIMRNNREIPKFKEPELERIEQRLIKNRVFEKLKKIKIPGESE